jgi:hypothetical protein
MEKRIELAEKLFIQSYPIFELEFQKNKKCESFSKYTLAVLCLSAATTFIEKSLLTEPDIENYILNDCSVLELEDND